MQKRLILNSNQRTRGTAENPTFVLQTGIQANSCYVRSVNIPNVFYNINDNNNLINVDFTELSTTDTDIQLTNGSYNTTQLMNHISAQITAGATGTNYLASYSNITHKISLTSTESFIVNWDKNAKTKQLANDLGFYPSNVSSDGKQEPVATTGTSHTANHVYWIQPIKTLYIQSSLCNHSSATATRSGSGFNILETVHTDTAFGESIVKSYDSLYLHNMNQSTTITEIDFKLLDENLNPLYLNGRDWMIELVFNV